MGIPDKLFSVNLTCLPYLAAAVLAVTTVPLHANPILPGQSGILPDIFTDPGSVPLVDSANGTFSFGSGVGLITGTWTEYVVHDPLGITCAGCLDFAYQVTLDPGLSSGLFAINMGGFAGYTTDAGYIDGTGQQGGSGGDGSPLLMSRGPVGGAISFFFNDPANSIFAPIGPGGSSALLVVATNATTYDNQGFLGIHGGRGADSPANGLINGLFEPTPVPEPSTVVLLGLGLVGIVALRKRIA